jgi:glutamine amidotransferase
MVSLIDYGAGNLTSVRKGFAAAGIELETAGSPESLAHSAAIVVPGVGHFSATRVLNERWRDAVRRRVASGVPIFGICLGMQWLFEGSTEAEEVPGLGLIEGTCRRLDAARPLKVPHVGWNTLNLVRGSGLMHGIEQNAHVYFTHAYAAPVTAACTATTSHGQTFAAVVEREQVFGVQFHPEKSSDAGLRILRNFAALARG